MDVKMTKYVIELPDIDGVCEDENGFVSRNHGHFTAVGKVGKLTKLEDFLGEFVKDYPGFEVVKSGEIRSTNEVYFSGYTDEIDDYGGEDVW